MPGHVGLHVPVLAPSFGGVRAARTDLPHDMVVRVHRASMLLRQANALSVSDARPAGAGHVRHVRHPDVGELGRLYLGGQQRPSSGNQHRLLSVSAVQYPVRLDRVPRTPDAHAEGGLRAGRRGRDVLYRHERRRDLDFVRAGAFVFSLRRREEEGGLPRASRHGAGSR